MGRHCARRPCPFCLHPYTDLHNYVSATHPEYWIRCSACYATGPRVDTKEGAQEGWDKALRVRDVSRLPIDFD